MPSRFVSAILIPSFWGTMEVQYFSESWIHQKTYLHIKYKVHNVSSDGESAILTLLIYKVLYVSTDISMHSTTSLFLKKVKSKWNESVGKLKIEEKRLTHKGREKIKTMTTNLYYTDHCDMIYSGDCHIAEWVTQHHLPLPTSPLPACLCLDVPCLCSLVPTLHQHYSHGDGWPVHASQWLNPASSRPPNFSNIIKFLSPFLWLIPVPHHIYDHCFRPTAQWSVPFMAGDNLPYVKFFAFSI